MKLIQNPFDFTLGILLALVFTLDIATTQICLSTGIGYEANPFINGIVNNPASIILVKAIGLFLIIILVNCYKTKWIGYLGMSIVIGITLGAVINNLMLIV